MIVVLGRILPGAYLSYIPAGRRQTVDIVARFVCLAETLLPLSAAVQATRFVRFDAYEIMPT